jgi:hypothetical protein
MATGSSDIRAPSRQGAPARRQVAVWAAWSICSVGWVAISTGYALRLATDTDSLIAEELGWRIGYGSCVTVGAIIVANRPRNVIGWILCAAGLAFALASFADDFGVYVPLRRPQWLPGSLVMSWFGPLAVVPWVRAGRDLPGAAVPRWAAAVTALAPGRLGSRCRPCRPVGVGGLYAEAGSWTAVDVYPLGHRACCGAVPGGSADRRHGPVCSRVPVPGIADAALRFPSCLWTWAWAPSLGDQAGGWPATDGSDRVSSSARISASG